MKPTIENTKVTTSEREKEQSSLRASLWLMGMLTLTATIVLAPLAS